MKIIIPGGHLTPALALIEYIQAVDKNIDFLYLGRKYSQEKLKQLSVERQEVEQRQVKYQDFEAVKLSNDISTIFKIGEFFKSVKTAKRIIKEFKADLVFSFGGYMALPVALAAKKLDIPIITHEQTRNMGFTNEIISHFAKVTALSFPLDKMHDSFVVVGNPLRESLKNINPKKPDWYIRNNNYPTLLVMGGNQGSHSINTLIKDNFQAISQKFSLLMATGKKTRVYDFKKELESLKQLLPTKDKARIFIKEWFSSEELAYIYNVADIALSRSGANTVQELVYKQIPTFFIPLPMSRKAEQLKNARAIEKQGGAIVRDETLLFNEDLMPILNELLANKAHYRQNLKKINIKVDACKELYLLIKKVHDKKST